MKKIYTLLIMAIIFVGLQEASYGSAQLHEVISVGTSTASSGTSTLEGTQYDAASYFEAFYSFQGAGACYFRFDGGTPTTNSHVLANNGALELDNIKDARRVKFLSTVAAGTITATYSTAKEPIR